MASSLAAGLSAALAATAAAPPVYVFVIVTLPHLLYMWVLTQPRSTIAVARLFGAEPVDWFASVALVLNAAQLAAVGSHAVSSGHYSPSSVLSQLTLPRVALGAVMWAAGLVLKISIFTAIGKRGVYYGTKFGHSIPWIDGFPFSVTGAPSRPPPARGCSSPAPLPPGGAGGAGAKP